jgi:very-short-patch-repair endonuclease
MGKPVGKQPTPDKQSLCAKRRVLLQDNATESEKRMIEILQSANIRFEFQKGFIAGFGFSIVDFYLPGHATCIEVDGGYHTTKEQQERDRRRSFYLKVIRRMKVIRFTNDQVFSLPHSEIVSEIRCAMNAPRPAKTKVREESNRKWMSL